MDSGATIFAPASQASPTRENAENGGLSSFDAMVSKIPGLPKVADTVSNVDMAQVSAKVGQLKKWTIGTFKNSRQQLLEQMGKVDRTVDPEFEQACQNLKDLHRRYGAVVTASKQFSQALAQLTVAEKNMADALQQLSMQENGLKAMCSSTGESIKKIGDQAANLDNCVKYFLSSVETIHTKSITDTLDTIYSTEGSRIEYDVCRHELSTLQMQATASPTAIQEAQTKLEYQKEKYEQLKDDVRVKLRLLEENRIGVMAIQLEKIQIALAAYFSGNAELMASAVAELAAMIPSCPSFLSN